MTRGSDAALTKEQLRFLDQHLSENLYLTAEEIAHYVEQTWQVAYSESGITQLLHVITMMASLKFSVKRLPCALIQIIN